MQETAKALVLQKANKLKLQHATYELPLRKPLL